MLDVQNLAIRPLTQLTEDEAMFQSTVRKFARERIAPYVREMDEAAVFRRDLIQSFFELGLMGIEIPEEYGGQGGSFFQSILAIEELAAVDASAAVIVDVQNTLFVNAILRWANDDQKRRYLREVASGTVGAYALSEAGSGSDALAMQSRAVQRGSEWILNGRKLWITNAAEAGLFLRRQKGGQARHPRFLHLRADSGRLPRSRKQRSWRSRQGLQNRP